MPSRSARSADSAVRSTASWFRPTGGFSVAAPTSRLASTRSPTAPPCVPSPAITTGSTVWRSTRPRKSWRPEAGTAKSASGTPTMPKALSRSRPPPATRRRPPPPPQNNATSLLSPGSFVVARRGEGRVNDEDSVEFGRARNAGRRSPLPTRRAAVKSAPSRGDEMAIRFRGCQIARWLWRAAAIGLLLVVAPHTMIAEEGKDTLDGRSSRQDVFETGKVWNVHIVVPAVEYEAMQPRQGQTFLGMLGIGGRKKTDKPEREVHRNTFGMDLPWATAAVTFDGETFPDVGIRYKGNGTIGDASRTIKKSFKIDLDHLGGTARFRGLKTINLHCGVADPSKCREALGYGLYRAAGVPASLTVLAEVRLTVPGKYDHELLCLYTVVEQVDKPFLREHFGTDKGLLMKPEGLRD